MENRAAVNTLIGLLFVVSAAFGVYLIAQAIWEGFSTLEGGVASAVVAAAGAVLLAIINIVAQRYVERRREIEVRQRDKKIDLYQQFTKFWFEFLLSPENRRARAEGTHDVTASVPEMNNLTQQIILWGSDGVLKRYSDLRRHITNPEHNQDHVKTMLLFEKVLSALRKDLGHSNQGLKERDILALFINDVDKLDSRPPARA